MFRDKQITEKGNFRLLRKYSLAMWVKRYYGEKVSFRLGNQETAS